MTERFVEQATGATELRVELKKGDVVAHEGQDWNLEWNSDGSDAPEVERHGNVLRIRQRGNGFLPGGFELKRMDMRLTVPGSVEVAELRTGLGKVDAEGLRGRLTLTTGTGALSLHGAGGDASLNTANGAVTIEGYDGKLTASTGNGRVRVNRLKGELTLNTGNGTVEVLDVEGRVRASTGNGEVKLTGVAGEAELNSGHGAMEILAPRSLDVQANTAMGSIHVDGGSLRGMRGNSMMGEIRCAARFEPGKYELSSGVGAITVQLAADTLARVDAQTGFGQVESDFPLVRVGRSGPMGFGGVRMVGSIGEGEPRVELSLRSGKGSIRLRRTSAGVSQMSAQPMRVPQPAPSPQEQPSQGVPQPPSAPVAPVDPTLAVLEAVARGELSPEDAELLLAATPNRA